jgi:hypothetical protein
METWWSKTDSRRLKYADKLVQYCFVYHKSRIDRPRDKVGPRQCEAGDRPNVLTYEVLLNNESSDRSSH